MDVARPWPAMRCFGDLGSNDRCAGCQIEESGLMMIDRTNDLKCDGVAGRVLEEREAGNIRQESSRRQHSRMAGRFLERHHLAIERRGNLHIGSDDRWRTSRVKLVLRWNVRRPIRLVTMQLVRPYDIFHSATTPVHFDVFAQ